MLALERADSSEAFGGPELPRVVVDVERRHPLRQRHPRLLRAGEDVDVGRDARGLVERPRTDERDDRIAVVAVERDLALGTAEDGLRRAVVAEHLDQPGLARRELDAVGLDQDVDRERAPGLPLAVEAMAAVHEKRVARQAIPNHAT